VACFLQIQCQRQTQRSKLSTNTNRNIGFFYLLKILKCVWNIESLYEWTSRKHRWEWFCFQVSTLCMLLLWILCTPNKSYIWWLGTYCGKISSNYTKEQYSGPCWMNLQFIRLPTYYNQEGIFLFLWYVMYKQYPLNATTNLKGPLILDPKVVVCKVMITVLCNLWYFSLSILMFVWNECWDDFITICDIFYFFSFIIFKDERGINPTLVYTLPKVGSALYTSIKNILKFNKKADNSNMTWRKKNPQNPATLHEDTR